MNTNLHMRSVRRALIVPFVVLTIVGVGLVAFLSARAGQEAVAALASRLGVEIGANVMTELEQHMSIPLLVNRINLNNLENELLDLNDVSMRNRYFAAQMEAFPLISYSFLGLETADFYGARRNEEGGIEAILNNAETGGASWYYRLDGKRDAIEKVVEIPNFDCRTRPWYKAGKEAGKAVYSQVYRHFVYKDLAVTAAEPWYARDGRFLGVLGVDFRLDSINSFLAAMPATNFATILIVEQETGKLVGNSLGKPNFRNGADGSLERLGPQDLDDPALGNIVDQLSPDSVTRLTETRIVTIGSERGGIQTIQIPFGHANLQWRVVVLVPEATFMERVNRSLAVVVTLVLLVLAAAVGTGFVLALRLFRPLDTLITAAGALEAGDLDHQSPEGTWEEWNRLAHAFNTMARRLRETIRSQEETIEQRTRELREANATKDRFFSIVAHDLRGPVGSLALLLETLSRQGPEQAEHHAMIMEQAAGHTKTLHEFLESLLAWALSQQGKLECKPVPLSLDAIQKETTDIHAAALGRKSVRINLVPTDIRVCADIDMTRTIFRNLFSNAIKFTPVGGQIDIVCTRKHEKAEITIRDSGIGMKADELESILSLDKAPSRRGTMGEKGSGLGLVLCKDFVEKNGGTLRITSASGKGTSVVFTLPLCDREPTGPESPPPA